MTWKSIESAPRDGTHVLAYGDGVAAVLEWITISRLPEGGYWSAIGASGYECETDLEYPTHWMPLPEPPPPPSEGEK